MSNSGAYVRNILKSIVLTVCGCNNLIHVLYFQSFHYLFRSQYKEYFGSYHVKNVWLERIRVCVYFKFPATFRFQSKFNVNTFTHTSLQQLLVEKQAKICLSLNTWRYIGPIGFLFNFGFNASNISGTFVTKIWRYLDVTSSSGKGYHSFNYRLDFKSFRFQSNFGVYASRTDRF